ncbi:hypothetical protein LUU34_00847900 [Aix galericulata]|nr:hypothetical protein LUU34_00847900 [Aix galericulata]
MSPKLQCVSYRLLCIVLAHPFQPHLCPLPACFVARNKAGEPAGSPKSPQGPPAPGAPFPPKKLADPAGSCSARPRFAAGARGGWGSPEPSPASLTPSLAPRPLLGALPQTSFAGAPEKIIGLRECPKSVPAPAGRRPGRAGPVPSFVSRRGWKRCPVPPRSSVQPLGRALKPQTGAGVVLGRAGTWGLPPRRTRGGAGAPRWRRLSSPGQPALLEVLPRKVLESVWRWETGLALL